MILVVEQRSNLGLGKVKSRSNLGVGRFTYSEAMLISGASKQISCAILYYFVFFEFKLTSSPKVQVYMPQYFALDTIAWWLNCQGWQIRRSQVPITLTKAKIDERFDDSAELEILLLPSYYTIYIHLLVNIFNESIYDSPVRNFLKLISIILAG